MLAKAIAIWTWKQPTGSALVAPAPVPGWRRAGHCSNELTSPRPHNLRLWRLRAWCKPLNAPNQCLMFRTPRANSDLPPSSKLAPSVGRPPSPHDHPPPKTTAAKSASKMATPRQKPAAARPSSSQTTLVPLAWGKKSPATNGFKGKPKATPNGNIMAFFKKAEEQNNRLFMEDRGAKNMTDLDADEEALVGWTDNVHDVMASSVEKEDIEQRYNEIGGSNKKQRISKDVPATGCTPPPPENADNPGLEAITAKTKAQPARVRRGPFIDDSDSEADDFELPLKQRSGPLLPLPTEQPGTGDGKVETHPMIESAADTLQTHQPRALLKTDTTSQAEDVDFDEFGDMEEEEYLEGEENDERRWMEEQQRLEMAEAGFDDEFEDSDILPMFPEPDIQLNNASPIRNQAATLCPICEASLEGLNDEQASVHVNGCLDGNPVPIEPPNKPKKKEASGSTNGSKMFKLPPRPARPGQQNPFQLGATSSHTKSAFSQLMAGHAEDAAWATAAAAESAARGKPSYQRTCPFYKILPGFYICVDAFRYGAVKGQNAYFLSHFHSDHYVGLTSSWRHGPIYCSKVTANLVRQQLQVNPKCVVDLEFEKKTEVPGTEGVYVTMISANHCPGSSLFLFEKENSKSRNIRNQRVLHCGDFRACQTHIEHPLLRPDVLDVVTGKTRQQKLDVCYLDTTYLNPKYAFPPQQQVIQACADMCVSLNKEQVDNDDGWEQMKRERAGEGMVKFLRKDVEKQAEGGNNTTIDSTKTASTTLGKQRGRLLVVVGTYSIGKERICVGIAKALGSKIFASKGKQRICHALEDAELDALLTSDPREAQVHMTPLFEIRADTLEDYLRDYSDRFSRAVAFRPSGWNYRPPNSRFTESPQVQTVLHSQNWKSQFSMRDLKPQPGSTSRASCFGVPYSEHSSFRELTMFCCALRIDKIIPTVNVGSAKSREKMKGWCNKWAADKKKNGLFQLKEDGSGW
ncbi:DRMBL-domain-containing protein [Polyplosphaeria fusca]|uniref:DRMBL-domain-containing protein n=1 Tax=Polyplosphaeria fusca TaxID=682080 RepID=A0A9P4QLS6_9PLEO|nr:DRMBL-domain-containing protein [Polyplosphaeria fusca]